MDYIHDCVVSHDQQPYLKSQVLGIMKIMGSWYHYIIHIQLGRYMFKHLDKGIAIFSILPLDIIARMKQSLHCRLCYKELHII